MDNPPNWSALVLEPAFLTRVDKLALRRFGLEGLAEEAASHVLDGLSANNWAACQAFTGKAQPSTYLLTLASHLLEDFSRRRFGRPRPPEWLKREGDLWVRIWQQICLERQWPQTVIDSLSHNLREPAFIQNIIRTIKAKLPWCGQSAREIPDGCFACNDDSLPEQETPSLHTALANSELETTLAGLHGAFFQPDCPSTQPSDHNKTPLASDKPMPTQNIDWQQLRSQLALTDEEHTLLKLAHEEGLKMNQIAQLLGMPSYQPGRLLKALHQRLHSVLTSAGIRWEPSHD